MSEFGSVSRPQLSDEAAAYVRNLIMAGQLRTGEFVRPETISDALGISATPAREALQALKTEGFLRLEPRRGFVVAKLTGKDIRDLFAAQALIAGELAARAALLLDGVTIDRLDELQSNMTRAAAADDSQLVEQFNHLFHREVNLAADAPKLAWTLSLMTRYVPTRFYSTIPGWPQATLDDHSDLIDAFRRNDAAGARSAMIEHIEHSGALLADHFDLRPSAVAAQ